MKRYRLTLKEQSYDPAGNKLSEKPILDNFLDGIDIKDWHIAYTETLLKLKIDGWHTEHTKALEKLKRMENEKATA